MSETLGVSSHASRGRKRSERVERRCRTCKAVTEHSKRPDARYRSGFNLVCLACSRERHRRRQLGLPTRRKRRHPRIVAIDEKIATLKRKRAEVLKELEEATPPIEEEDDEDIF